jgi:hypothetical protein
MTLADAIATQGDVLRFWVLWLSTVMLAAPLLLLVFRDTRRDGIVGLAAALAVMVSMQWLYTQVGFVRLLGLPHVVIWTPLALYLLVRLRGGRMPALARVVTWALLLSIVVSLAFDYIDVIRWLLGERGSLLPSGAARALSPARA